MRYQITHKPNNNNMIAINIYKINKKDKEMKD